LSNYLPNILLDAAITISNNNGSMLVAKINRASSYNKGLVCTTTGEEVPWKTSNPKQVALLS